MNNFDDAIDGVGVAIAQSIIYGDIELKGVVTAIEKDAGDAEGLCSGRANACDILGDDDDVWPVAVLVNVFKRDGFDIP